MLLNSQATEGISLILQTVKWNWQQKYVMTFS